MDLGGPLVSTTLALLVVCALAVGALRALGRRAPSVPGLRVVGKLRLDARRALFVVEAGTRCLVVAVGDGPVTLLTELDPQSLLVETPSPAPSPSPVLSSPVPAAITQLVRRALGLARS